MAGRKSGAIAVALGPRLETFIDVGWLQACWSTLNCNISIYLRESRHRILNE